MTKFDVLCLSHGNERMSAYVHDEFETNPVKDVRSRIAHPEAARLGVRSLGKTQIMNDYPGTLDGTLDERAAARNMHWLGDDINNEEVIVADIHNNPTPGNNYFGIGRRALQASMGSAYLLGYETCVVCPSIPFSISK
jgi:hypothetical protein